MLVQFVYIHLAGVESKIEIENGKGFAVGAGEDEGFSQPESVRCSSTGIFRLNPKSIIPLPEENFSAKS